MLTTLHTSTLFKSQNINETAREKDKAVTIRQSIIIVQLQPFASLLHSILLEVYIFGGFSMHDTVDVCFSNNLVLPVPHAAQRKQS